ncbi:hypothetical protein V1283_000023 [Bradyrhizobium sp. AZCC 2262]|uniref:hypothetical protein n=1 Tax=Bradyrhizobium sp. AZCC 2262 TaxID=3117022 RepID=UPI002FEF4A37
MPIRKKTSDQVRDLAVVAQCLDNQWLPPELASKLDGERGYHSLGEHRTDAIRREFMGALLTSEQLILNRAYLYSNDVIGDLCSHKTERDELVKLFDKEQMIIFFAGERSLEDKLNFKTYEHHLTGHQLAALRALFTNSDIPCLRFDWNDDERNRDMLVNHLARPFHNYAQTLNTVDHFERLAADLKIPEQKWEHFADTIAEVVKFAVGKRAWRQEGGPSYVTREQMYEQFVSLEGKTVGGFLDANKPFAREIKALVDLKYNCNLPDALSRYAVTSAGDIDRTVLHEPPKSEVQLSLFDAEDEAAFIDLLTRGAFDELNTFNSFDFLQKLSLADVLQLRANPSWSEYADTVKRILPARNSGRLAAHAIFDSKNLEALNQVHAALLTNAAQVVATREVMEEVSGWWEIGASFANVGVKIFSEFVGGHSIEIPHELPSMFAEATSPILIEATYNTIDKRGRKRAIRKYPLLKKRVENPADMFRRTREKIAAYQKARGNVSVKDTSETKAREDDRENTINLPE